MNENQHGISYLGLSSGATFLRAIKRLSPKPLTRVTISSVDTGGSLSLLNNAIDSGMRDHGGGCVIAEGKPTSWGPTLPVSNMGGTLNLPSMSEVMPLVDNYFRHFRKYTPMSLF